MHSSPTAVLMLADVRHRELQDDATRFRLAREAYGGDPTLRPAISTASRHLGEALVRAFQQVKSIRWTISLTSRSAVPR
jgi:hypothetical protein